MKRTLITALCLGGSLTPALGQLAITEAMSAASLTFGGAAALQMADFWELTNFGTNDINLTGCKWNDNSGGLVGADDLPFRGLTITNGESILFVKQFEPPRPPLTEQDVRNWWGPCLPSTTRIVFYYDNGFGQGGDGIRLWAAGETDPANVVDSVDFGLARRGRTFTYDPADGIFGQFSVEGTNRACKAATRDDVGSPGTTTGPVPLQIFTQPANSNTCAGVDATFSVQAGGLPPPKFQWFFNGSVQDGETGPSYTVVNPQATNAGEYWVEVSNGFQTSNSQVAVLSVSSDPTPPYLFVPMADALALTNETARFSVLVCAFPPPTFQWQTNGVDLPGATNRTLVLPNVQLSMSGMMYCVHIQNDLGSTSVCARLTVTPKPDLCIREVHPAPSANFAPNNADWFELWNNSTFSVNLLGYRWASGNGRAPVLDGARVVTNSAILHPGQCAIFVERLTREEFVHWWGADRLPPGLIVLTYGSEGLDGVTGDELYLWSPGGTLITSISWVPARNGVSKFYLTCSLDALDYDSVLGERGAFQAEQSDDIGSPGYFHLTNPPPRIVHISRGEAGTTLRWRAVVGTNYVLKWTQRLTNPVWATLFTRTATNWVEEATDSAGAEQRFYRLEESP